MKFPQTAKPVICRVLSGISVKICPAAILKLFCGSSPKYFNEGCNIVHWCTKIFCLVLSAFRNISDIIDIMIQKYSFFVPSVLFRQIPFLSYYIFLIKKQKQKTLHEISSTTNGCTCNLQRHLNTSTPYLKINFLFCRCPFIFEEHLNPQVRINQMVNIVSTGNILERQGMHAVCIDRVYYSLFRRWNPTSWSVKMQKKKKR